MEAMRDFLRAALPWIAIGLFVAFSIGREEFRKKGAVPGKLFSAMCWSPIFCFLLVAILEFSSGNKGSATTWLVLGIVNAGMNFANRRKAEK